MSLPQVIYDCLPACDMEEAVLVHVQSQQGPCLSLWWGRELPRVGPAPGVGSCVGLCASLLLLSHSRSVP